MSFIEYQDDSGNPRIVFCNYEEGSPEYFKLLVKLGLVIEVED